MGSSLMPNPQARSTIEKLVRSGVLGGDKAERWLARLKDEEVVKAMRAKEEGGDAGAMFNLGNWYNGNDEKGMATAYGWYKRGADVGHASCMWQAGVCLVFGRGVKTNLVYGMVLVTRAADGGSA
eukprot:1309899-Prymnesium_polylepis.1